MLGIIKPRDITVCVRKNILWLTLLSIFVVACVPKSELEQAQAENNSLRSQITQLQQQVTELQSKLMRKPILPVKINFRKAFLGPGYVAVFKTTIQQDFPVLVTVKSRALGTTSQKYKLNLSITMPAELGHVEGTPIVAGDEIIVENNNYEPTSVVFSP